MSLLKIKEVFWRGSDPFHSAWRLSNDKIRLTVMKLGGHIAQISDDTDEAVNPLWQPHWDSKDASKIPYDGTASLKRGWVMAKNFGGDAESALLAGIVGHNLCIDRFGPPRMIEYQQGKFTKQKQEWRPVHGEAGVLPWVVESQDNEQFRIKVELPEAKLAVSRCFQLDGQHVNLETTVTPTDGIEKEIEWCEHVTIGDPFLDGAQIEADVKGAWMFPEKLESSRFPNIPPLGEVPFSEAIKIPGKTDPPCGDVITSAVNDGYFKVSNHGKTLAYSWSKEDFPWLCLWTEHLSRTGLPWEGVERTRGLEFSSKAFPEGEPPAERKSEFQGVSTSCHIPVSGRTTNVSISWM
eukprot:m.337087 g.337087  ORF g.337087 m.337087 type:complete len:351 (+) comp18041_c0_seq1:135-1187(+)